MKIAFRHIQNNCVLCHANKLKDVDPMGECMPIMVKFVICVPVALVVSGLAYRSCRNAYEENKSQYVLFQKLCKLPLNYVGKRGKDWNVYIKMYSYCVICRNQQLPYTRIYSVMKTIRSLFLLAFWTFMLIKPRW